MKAASIFSGTAPERWQRFELAAHVFSDFVQGRQHSEGPGHALTKGPLKYAGRAVEHLCTLYGMKPWKDLAPDDRVALLRRVWPHLDPKTGMGARVLAQISGALDVATYVKREKELPGGLDAAAAAKADQVMLGFLRNATGLTVGKMAQDMLHPPAFELARHPRSQPVHDRQTVLPVVVEPFGGRQCGELRHRVVVIDGADRVEHVPALGGKVLLDSDELPAAVRQAVRHDRVEGGTRVRARGVAHQQRRIELPVAPFEQ